MNVNAKLVLKNILMKNISKNLIFQESTKALLLKYCLKHKMLSSNRKMSRDVSPPPKKFFPEFAISYLKKNHIGSDTKKYPNYC